MRSPHAAGPQLTRNTVAVSTARTRDPGRVARVDVNGFSLDLNRLQEVILEGQDNPESRSKPENQVFVTPSGEILLGNDMSPVDRSRTAQVEGDGFFMDLNHLQSLSLEGQENAASRSKPENQVFVTQSGELLLGNDMRPADRSRMARVEGDTFFARDLAEEERVVSTKMPASRKMSDGTYEGYLYTIKNDFGDTFKLFIYYTPTYDVYRVALVEPRLGGTVNAHEYHLWSDDTICLTRHEGSGYRSMEASYAKSVLWTLGASLAQRGYGFQFNQGQN